MTVGRVVAFADYLGCCVGPTSRYMYVRCLYHACRGIETGRDWAWFRELVQFLELDAVRRPRETGYSSVALFRIGADLMVGARTVRPHGRLAYRDGLMIAFLAVRPLRRRNLAMLEIGRQFLRLRNGYAVVLGSSETKNGNPVEFRIPSYLESAFDCYLAKIRPAIPGSAQHTALWAGQYGAPMAPGAIYAVIRKRTKAGLGRAVGPHAFRAAAATTVAERAPERIQQVPAILGNRSHAASENHYNYATTYDASLRYCDLLGTMMDEI